MDPGRLVKERSYERNLQALRLFYRRCIVMYRKKNERDKIKTNYNKNNIHLTDVKIDTVIGHHHA